nr:ribonuclease H-like domain-containing protein [Tanacetum cinerariifolium]
MHSLLKMEYEGMIGAIKLRKRLLQTMHSWILHLQEVLLVWILSQVSDKSKADLGYKEQIPESFVNSSELLEKQNNRSTKGYHEVPPPVTGNYVPPKRYKEQIPESFVNSSELLEKQNNRSTKGYHEVPPPVTRNYVPPKRDMWLIDKHFKSEYVDVSTVSSSADKIVDITHKDDDSEDELSPTIEVQTVKPSVEKIESVKNPKETKEYKEKEVINSGCSRHMTGNKCYLTDFKASNGGLVSFGDGKAISGEDIKREYNVARTPQRNGVAERRNRTLIEAARTMVNDSTARERAVKEYKEKGVIDSGCSRHMTGNKCYLTDFKAFNSGFVSFGDGKAISGEGKIKTGKLDFDDVYFCKELKYNMFSVS